MTYHRDDDDTEVLVRFCGEIEYDHQPHNVAGDLTYPHPVRQVARGRAESRDDLEAWYHAKLDQLYDDGVEVKAARLWSEVHTANRMVETAIPLPGADETFPTRAQVRDYLRDMRSDIADARQRQRRAGPRGDTLDFLKADYHDSTAVTETPEERERVMRQIEANREHSAAGAHLRSDATIEQATYDELYDAEGNLRDPEYQAGVDAWKRYDPKRKTNQEAE